MKNKLKKIAPKAFLAGSLAATLALTGAGLASASGPQDGNQAPFNPQSVQNQNHNQNSGSQNGQNQGGQNNKNQNSQNNNKSGQEPADWQNNQNNNSNDNQNKRNQDKNWNGKDNSNRNDQKDHNWNDHNNGSDVSIYGKVESTDNNQITIKADNGHTYTVDTSSVDASNKNGDSMRASDIGKGDYVSVRGSQKHNSDTINAKTLRDFDQS
ncbi:MAG: hypothetical protein P4L62_04070 [Candidatus Pacebacteria bacterium]|nr:hypothetical protein [Candidatus Paceibacterota bacterium]MDR3583507.1 hypothetical protein [Candidatus Paceibacterota bacterium]